MTVEEMKDRMDSHELMRWKVLFELERTEQESPQRSIVTDSEEITRWFQTA